MNTHRTPTLAGQAASPASDSRLVEAHPSNLPGAMPIQKQSVEKKSVIVSDGTRLNYLEVGQGQTLLMVPGWSQTAEQFRFQLEGLASHYRVIAVDMRGHGDSDKPAHGYRIQRLAKDLDDVMAALGLTDVNLLCHSMGNSVAWCHLDMFGWSRIARYLCIDQPTFLVPDPAWTPQQVADYGAIFQDANHAASVVAAVAADLGNAEAPTTTAFLASMTRGMSAELCEWIKAETLKMPRDLAARLLQSHCYQDWRDVIPRIDKPTLFVGGTVSNVPHPCVQWQHTQVRNAQIRIFEEAEGGSHFMFIQNSAAFNAMVHEFIG
ncbi:alpha/beta hydrolase [Pigmentiphaga aceris]|uniref:Alpha/beta hydrolase n=1 Tax=Pigmentiphaga aceris TaxID=1940612 RepID=A0A5C0B172_9BURK|nr:alpha/beta hydrolase [Pigmentiphaga aceris]QEI06417.1 alpha/beta hydrolase [Pigmentiphaga aceris]